jgi:hypothetical protein
VVKSVTVPGKCYAISDGDRQDDPENLLFNTKPFNSWEVSQGTQKSIQEFN